MDYDDEKTIKQSQRRQMAATTEDQWRFVKNVVKSIEN
jgi:hypothetical protein